MQFLTWRLADSIPAEVLAHWMAELESTPPEAKQIELARRINACLDQGYGSGILRNPIAARIVQESLLHDHGQDYELHAWVVMPNHVHCMFTPSGTRQIGDIMKRIKGATATKINRALGLSPPLWQKDYFDRLIRSEDHADKVRRYIEWNPVKAKFCSDPRQWAYSSAFAHAD